MPSGPDPPTRRRRPTSTRSAWRSTPSARPPARLGGGYLEYHRRRYQDTLRFLPPGGGRRLLDVGSFPGHLGSGRNRGWEVTGLNNTIEGADVWTEFLARCGERRITILAARSSGSRSRCPPRRSTRSLLRAVRAPPLEPVPHPEGDLPGLRPGGLLVLTTPNLRRVETLFRLLHDWGSQPPVSRTFRELFLAPVPPPQSGVHGQRAPLLPRAPGETLRLPAGSRVLRRRLDAAHEVPGVFGQRAGSGEQARPGPPPAVPVDPRPAHRPRVADRGTW